MPLTPRAGMGVAGSPECDGSRSEVENMNKTEGALNGKWWQHVWVAEF